MFKYEPRRTDLARAGHRCEAPLFLAWGRCPEPATEADHVYPWSKGGATVVSNGQALCSGHHRRKGNLTPPWWYLLRLEQRLQHYFPDNVDVEVRAAMTSADKARRDTPARGTGDSRS